MIDRIGIVVGYHPFVAPPDKAVHNQLNNRFAVVFDTYSILKTDWVFDDALFSDLVPRMVNALLPDQIEVELEDENIVNGFEALWAYYASIDAADREPPAQ